MRRLGFANNVSHPFLSFRNLSIPPRILGGRFNPVATRADRELYSLISCHARIGIGVKMCFNDLTIQTLGRTSEKLETTFIVSPDTVRPNRFCDATDELKYMYTVN